MTDLPILYLSRRNLLTLLSKLDRRKRGEHTFATILKAKDAYNPDFPQTVSTCLVKAVEDGEYYKYREAGEVLAEDDPDIQVPGANIN